LPDPAATQHRIRRPSRYFMPYSSSTPSAANPCKSADPILHQEPPLLKNRSNATGNFKNLKSVGVPLFGPNLSFKVII
jgi:hypothetical protein